DFKIWALFGAILSRGLNSDPISLPESGFMDSFRKGFSFLNNESEITHKLEGSKHTLLDHDDFGRPFHANVSGYGIGSASDFIELNNYPDAVLKYINRTYS
ncbi:hypothetical protein U1Q18_019501, partial [Sarracenia purpurea var. burkii]